MTDPNILVLTEAIATLINKFDAVTSAQLEKQTADPQSLSADLITHSNLTFETFDDSKETFKCYKERLENFFTLRLSTKTNSDEIKARILINCIGTKHYQLLSSLTAPDLPVTKTYNKLIELLENHLCPAPNVYTEQHRFLCRSQAHGESIAEFIAALRKMTITCNFVCENKECGKSNAFQFLRAQFIRGLYDTSIREKLLQEKTLTFDKACEIALALEASKQGNKEISSSSSEIAVGRIEHRNSSATHNPVNKWGNQLTNPQRSESHLSLNLKSLGIDNLCLRCGYNNHIAQNCKRDRNSLKCKSCGRTGHLSKVCIQTLSKMSTKPTTNSNSIRQLSADSGYQNDSSSNFNTENDEIENYSINKLISINHSTITKSTVHDDSKFMVEVNIGTKSKLFEVDSGSPVSIMNNRDFQQLGFNLKMNLKPTNIQFRTYTGEPFKPLGVVKVPVQYQGNRTIEDLYIVNTPSAAILGRTWLRHLDISINRVETNQPRPETIRHDIEEIISLFKNVFEPKVGLLPKFKCCLIPKESIKPIFLKARPIPYALKDKIELELKNLEDQGIITKTGHSEWGSPLVVVPKPDGNIRLCVDFKLTLNPQLLDARYPIPRIEDIFNKMKGGKFFCTLDVHKAYLHLEMDDESKLLQTISTHKGTYTMNRLAFGIKTAPNEFQKVMDNAVSDLEGTAVYYDDIVIQGSTFEECKRRLIKCLRRMQELDLHLNIKKCQFFQKEINYLGHIISSEGLKKSPDKVKAIIDAPRPTNVDELRSFLGLTTYYSKFMPHASTLLQPLNNLLKKNMIFHWSTRCEEAFTKVKKEILSDRILVPFDPRLPLTLATDASPVGLSGVLSHNKNGTEHPIAFISRSLSTAEKGYSQLDKEATAVYWSFQKFYQYLFGRRFTLIIDNKPLQAIFNPNKSLPSTTMSRLLRYATFLSGFDYVVEHRRSELHSNADYFSRFPLALSHSRSTEEDELHDQTINAISTETITHAEIVRKTNEDPFLKQLRKDLLSGMEISTEYSLHKGAIFRGQRVVIPEQLQPQILSELHDTHPGIVRMKSLARRYCYWKNIDKDIEHVVKSCKSCCDVKNNPPKAPLHVWEQPEECWQRVHIDYAGPFKGHHFMILVDAKSKWPEIKITSTNPTTKCTIEMLNEVFSRNGLPEFIVSDNATIFTSLEFKSFCVRNGIRQRLIAPGHPATNGQAERYVQTLKQKLKAMDDENVSLHTKLNSILFKYRATPLACGKTPAEQFLGRNIRTKLDLLRFPISDKNKAQQPRLTSSLSVGERVQVRNYSSTAQWLYGTILEKLGKLHYLIELDRGYTVKRHLDQLRACEVEHTTEFHPSTLQFSSPTTSFSSTTNKNQEFPYQPESESRSSQTKEKSQEFQVLSPEDYQMNNTQDPSMNQNNNKDELPPEIQTELRRSQRIRRPVVRMNL